MKVDDFNNIVTMRMEVVKKTLIGKAKEYANDEERFANFKAVAAMNNQTPEEALWGMVSKHVISVRDMCKGGKVTQELINEKIGDWITYGFLMEGIFAEKLYKEAVEVPDMQEVGEWDKR